MCRKLPDVLLYFCSVYQLASHVVNWAVGLLVSWSASLQVSWSAGQTSSADRPFNGTKKTPLFHRRRLITQTKGDCDSVSMTTATQVKRAGSRAMMSHLAFVDKHSPPAPHSSRFFYQIPHGLNRIIITYRATIANQIPSVVGKAIASCRLPVANKSDPGSVLLPQHAAARLFNSCLASYRKCMLLFRLPQPGVTKRYITSDTLSIQMKRFLWNIPRHRRISCLSDSTILVSLPADVQFAVLPCRTRRRVYVM